MCLPWFSEQDSQENCCVLGQGFFTCSLPWGSSPCWQCCASCTGTTCQWLWAGEWHPQGPHPPRPAKNRTAPNSPFNTLHKYTSSLQTASRKKKSYVDQAVQIKCSSTSWLCLLQQQKMCPKGSAGRPQPHLPVLWFQKLPSVSVREAICFSQSQQPDKLMAPRLGGHWEHTQLTTGSHIQAAVTNRPSAPLTIQVA